MARVAEYDMDQHLRYAWLVQLDADPNTGAVVDEQKLALREYLYDSDRARFLVRERDPNTFEVTAADWFEYLGDNIYQDLAVALADPNHPSISPIARYDWGYSLVGMDDPFGRRFVHADMLGTTRMITDPNAAVTHTLAYSAFGEVLAQGGSIGGSSAAGFSRYGYVGAWGYQNDALGAGVLGQAGSDLGLLHVGAGDGPRARRSAAALPHDCRGVSGNTVIDHASVRVGRPPHGAAGDPVPAAGAGALA